MDVNLNNMSLKDLRDLQSQVTKAVASFEDRKKKAAIAELEEKARAMGYSFAELSGAPTTMRKRSPAVPKYSNPAHAADTWSGRGRKPQWFVAALNAGKTPDDLLI